MDIYQEIQKAQREVNIVYDLVKDDYIRFVLVFHDVMMICPRCKGDMRIILNEIAKCERCRKKIYLDK